MGKAIDPYWHSIIDFTHVPSTEDLYIVGSFAKSVTVYSQQVRALNLIDAMCGLGRLRRSSRVAVIGGGIAGAAGAAWARGHRWRAGRPGGGEWTTGWAQQAVEKAV
jgi:hypothetical protein